MNKYYVQNEHMYYYIFHLNIIYISLTSEWGSKTNYDSGTSEFILVAFFDSLMYLFNAAIKQIMTLGHLNLFCLRF